jgi:hypothetical protein
MALRYLRTGVVAIVIAGGATGLSFAQQRDGGLLPPQESGMVTVAGCLVRGNQVRDGDKDKYVLANLKTGPASSVAEQTCTVDENATAIQLDNPEKGNLNESMLGHWVEISGRLEKESSTDNILRELDVTSARALPVDAPRAAAAEPSPVAANAEPATPAPQAAAAEPSPAPQPASSAASSSGAPVATSGQAALPGTASFGPLAGLIGLFSCGAGFVLRSFRSRFG